eukprot:6380174-Lingulodinium_polyedra.AAC.1
MHIEYCNATEVLIPGRRVWKVKRAKVMSAEIETLVDSGEFQLGPGQLEQAMSDIGDSFLNQRAVGVSLDSLLSSGPVPEAAPKQAVPGSGGHGSN